MEYTEGSLVRTTSSGREKELRWAQDSSSISSSGSWLEVAGARSEAGGGGEKTTQVDE